MQKQIYKVDLSISNTFDIPNGWEVDKYLDVNANYVIMVLNKFETQDEYNRRMGYSQPSGALANSITFNYPLADSHYRGNVQSNYNGTTANNIIPTQDEYNRSRGNF